MNLLRRLTTTGCLIVLNAIVYVAVVGGGVPEQYTCLPANASMLLQRPWTFLSYMFVHYSFWHLLMNMLWLWLFGRVLETVSSGRRILTLYLAGGVVGALFYLTASLWLPHAEHICGASAAGVAVMTAAGLRLPNMQLRLMLLGVVRLKWIVVAGVVLLFIGTGGAGVWAHLGGLVAGTSLTVVKLRRRSGEREKPRTHHPSRRRARRVGRELERRRRDTRRLDELLELVRISGFESLSRSEQTELKRISESLNTK